MFKAYLDTISWLGEQDAKVIECGVPSMEWDELYSKDELKRALVMRVVSIGAVLPVQAHGWSATVDVHGHTRIRVWVPHIDDVTEYHDDGHLYYLVKFRPKSKILLSDWKGAMASALTAWEELYANTNA